MLAQKTGKQISNESLRIGYSQFTTEIKSYALVAFTNRTALRTF